METLWWLVGKFFWLMAILMGLTSFYCLIRLKLLTFVKLAFFASLALGIGGCADEQAQLAAMTPEQRAEYELKQEQKKQEEKAAKEAKKAQEEADKKNAEEVDPNYIPPQDRINVSVGRLAYKPSHQKQVVYKYTSYNAEKHNFDEYIDKCVQDAILKGKIDFVYTTPNNIVFIGIS